MVTDVQFHGLELVRPDDLSAQLLQGGDVTESRQRGSKTNFAHIDPPVAAALGEEAKNPVAPRIFYSPIGLRLQNAAQDMNAND